MLVKVQNVQFHKCWHYLSIFPVLIPFRQFIARFGLHFLKRNLSYSYLNAAMYLVFNNRHTLKTRGVLSYWRTQASTKCNVISLNINYKLD